MHATLLALAWRALLMTLGIALHAPPSQIRGYFGCMACTHCIPMHGTVRAMHSWTCTALYLPMSSPLFLHNALAAQVAW